MTDNLIKWLPIFGEFVILALIIMIVLGFMIGYIKPTVGGYMALALLVFFLLMLHIENVKHFNKNEQDN